MHLPFSRLITAQLASLERSVLIYKYCAGDSLTRLMAVKQVLDSFLIDMMASNTTLSFVHTFSSSLLSAGLLAT